MSGQFYHQFKKKGITNDMFDNRLMEEKETPHNLIIFDDVIYT